jgi:excisionase family DNA binding protein
MMERLLLTVEEAAERLSIGRTKAYELMASGELESVTIGRCRRVPVEALEPFVAALRRIRNT